MMRAYSDPAWKTKDISSLKQSGWEEGRIGEGENTHFQDDVRWPDSHLSGFHHPIIKLPNQQIIHSPWSMVPSRL
jgi:hypothetical protein